MIKNGGQTILVVDDVEETLDGIKEMLTRDGYRVYAARDERDATDKARLSLPDLMLVSLEGEAADIIVAASRIRARRIRRRFTDYYFLRRRNKRRLRNRRRA